MRSTEHAPYIAMQIGLWEQLLGEFLDAVDSTGGATEEEEEPANGGGRTTANPERIAGGGGSGKRDGGS